MIIVRLMGGLGNQMFQYAFGKSLSLKYNRELKIDLSFLTDKNRPPGFVMRDYDLDIFTLIPDFDIPSQYYKVSERKSSYDIDLVNYIGSIPKSINILIEGYFQSPYYFKDFENQIKNDFNFKDDISFEKNTSFSLLLNEILESNSVMVNFRRTDFLTNNFHGVMGTDYMYRSIDKLELVNPKYFIFSDDIEWCVENINLDNMVFVDHSFKGNKFSKYLQLMINCKNFIIPNSTFAWWAAFLSEKSEKKVVCPLKWTQDLSWDSSDLIPKDWIRV